MRTMLMIAALVLSACASEIDSDVGSAPAAAQGDLWETSWVAQTIASKPVAPLGAVTMNFQTGTVGGNSGCNTFGGDVTLDGAKISFGPLISTKMACIEGGRMSQEFAFMQLLSDAARYERPSSNRLEIVTADGRRAVFSAQR